MVTRGTVLVIGGRGFIGSNVVLKLQAAGFRARVLDIRRESSLPAAANAEFLEGDFTDQAVARHAVAGVDAVVHLASVTTPQSGTNDPVHDVTQNLVGTIRLMDACHEQGVRKFVFASSGGAVYGKATRTPIPEDHAVQPLNSYGIVKLGTEKYLGLYSHLGRLDPVVLRPSNPYGPGQYPLGSQGAVAVALGCIRDRKPFQLWGDGSVVRDYLYIDDLAEAFLAAVLAPSGGPQVMNVGSSSGRSLLEVLEACRQVTGRPLALERLAGRPIDAPMNVLDSTVARVHLGWAPTVEFMDGLARTWRWMCEAIRTG